MLNSLKTYFDNIDKNLVPSLRCIVKKGNETVFEYFSARDDIYESEKEKDLCFIYSATKVITCTAILRLYEDGLLSLDDPVYKYLPEFKDLYVAENPQRAEGLIDEKMPKAKNVLTIRHLMSMQGGFSYNINHPEIEKAIKETEGNISTRQIATAISKMPLLFEPGTDYNYSLCHDILGAIIEVVSGLSFFDYLDKIIFTPLDMKNTFFCPDDEQLKRMHRQYYVEPTFPIAIERKPFCPYSVYKNWQSGGGGLVSTVYDYIKFASCLANGTSENGYRLLKKETIELFKIPQLSEKGKESFGVDKYGYSYGLGVRVHVNPDASNTLAPIGEFGWNGAAGAFTLIDPDNKISIAYTQHVYACSYTQTNIQHALRNLVYKELTKGE